MMISPEAYYVMHLEGKSREEVARIIRSLKRTIKKLQKSIENPAQRLEFICPSEEVQLCLYEQYLKRAVEAYMDLDTVE